MFPADGHGVTGSHSHGGNLSIRISTTCAHCGLYYQHDRHGETVCRRCRHEQRRARVRQEILAEELALMRAKEKEQIDTISRLRAIENQRQVEEAKAKADAAEQEALRKFAEQTARQQAEINAAAKKRAEEEAARQQAEIDAATQKRVEEEVARQLAQHQQKLAEEAAARQLAQHQQKLAEEEAARQLAQHQQKLAEEEAARILAQQQQRLAEEEAARQLAEQKRLADEAARNLAAAESARKRAEDLAMYHRAEDEARKRAAEAQERERRHAYEQYLAQQAELDRLRSESAARILAEEEHRKRVQEELARLQREEQARKKAEEEAARQVSIALAEQARLQQQARLDKECRDHLAREHEGREPARLAAEKAHADFLATQAQAQAIEVSRHEAGKSARDYFEQMEEEKERAMIREEIRKELTQRTSPGMLGDAELLRRLSILKTDDFPPAPPPHRKTNKVNLEWEIGCDGGIGRG